MVSSANNPVNNKIGASISGVTNTFTVTNPSNTASSAARETITVGGGTAGDPTINWNVSGATDWEMGIDNSVSDNLTISQGTALGTNDVWRMDTSGRRIMPLQPCFNVYLNTGVTNVTGDGTSYSILFDTILFDQASNITLNSGGKTIFTAPVTGKYLFTSTVRATNMPFGSNNLIIALQLTGKDFRLYETNKIPSSGDFISSGGSVCVNMTASDTAYIIVGVSGGAKTAGVGGAGAGPDAATFFSGFLIC